MPAVTAALPSIAAVAQAIAACRRFFHPHPAAANAVAMSPRTAELGSGTEIAPKRPSPLLGKPGGEVEDVLGAAAAAVAERQAPQLGRG